jgi:hypothetical protein
MHGVNLDLLRALARHHPDGQPKDAHAHHHSDHRTLLRAERRARWRARLDRLFRALALSGTSPAPSKPAHPAKL